MLEVDLDLWPRVEPERARAVSRADRQQLPRLEHSAAPGCASSDALELAKLLERVDAHVGVRADRGPDAPLEESGRWSEAVSKIGLRRRAHAHGRPGGGDEIQLDLVCMRGVHDGRARGEAPGSLQELDWSQ